MGYTHYWDQTAVVTPADWIEFAEGAERLVALVMAGGIALGNAGGRGKPTINGAQVAFNGVGEDAREGFAITRKIAADWTFCKTGRDNYDTAVAAVLVYLDSILPYAFATRSDGDLWNYRDALDLAKAAWPQKANQLDFPRAIRKRVRFESYLDYGKTHQVVVGWDGVTYIEDHATQDLRRLPDDMQGKAYSDWTHTVPHEMRKWGSFGAFEHDRCEAARMAHVWDLSKANPVAPVVYDPIVHGLKRPEIHSAHQW